MLPKPDIKNAIAISVVSKVESPFCGVKFRLSSHPDFLECYLLSKETILNGLTIWNGVDDVCFWMNEGIKFWVPAHLFQLAKTLVEEES